MSLDKDWSEFDSKRKRKTKKKKRYAKKYPRSKNRSRDYLHFRSVSGRYIHLRYIAKKRKKDFNISRSEYEVLLSQPCHYCNGPLNETGSGLDRVDNSQGYVTGNVVPCCRFCNCLKSDSLSYVETKIVLSALLEYRGSDRFAALVRLNSALREVGRTGNNVIET